jgi:hypothetical protein
MRMLAQMPAVSTVSWAILKKERSVTSREERGEE